MTEIRETMTTRELMEWAAYEQTFGSLLPHERIDAGFAQVSYMLSDGKRSVRDFMPQWFRDLTADDALMHGMAALKGMVDADD